MFYFKQEIILLLYWNLYC